MYRTNQSPRPAHVFTRPTHVFTRPTHVFTRPTDVFTRPTHVFTRPTHVATCPAHVATCPTHVFTRPTRLRWRPQSSLQVWKRVVSHTPRTLKEVLPVIIRIIIDCLAAPSYDRQQMGARTLGDLVRKLGDRILPEVMPTLEEGLQSPKTNIRQGVCVGLSEIMGAAGRGMVRPTG